MTNVCRLVGRGLAAYNDGDLERAEAALTAALGQVRKELAEGSG